MKSYLAILLLLPLTLSSCTFSSDWGMTGLIILFVLMLVMFGLTIFFIAKKKSQADKSIAKYNRDLNQALSKFETPEQKVEMLKILINRIKEDEKYKKDESWKNKVLVSTYTPLAAQYYKLGDEAQTLGVCSDIIALDPDHAMTYYNRGSIYSDMGLYEQALSDLNRTIELTPSYASAYNNRGMAYYRLQEYEKAIEDYNQAIEQEDSAISYYNRASAYLALKNKDQALNDFRKFIELDDSDDELTQDVISVIKDLEKE